MHEGPVLGQDREESFALQGGGEARECILGEVLPGAGQSLPPVQEVHVEAFRDGLGEPGLQGGIVHEGLGEGMHGEELHLRRHPEIHRPRPQEDQASYDGQQDRDAGGEGDGGLLALLQGVAVPVDVFHGLREAAGHSSHGHGYVLLWRG